MAERADPDGLGKALRRYWDAIKVSEKGKAKSEVEKVVKEIISRVETKDSRFKLGLEYRGSMYEKVKIKEADEFDFDLTITQLTIEEAPKGRPPNTSEGSYIVIAILSTTVLGRKIMHSFCFLEEIKLI